MTSGAAAIDFRLPRQAYGHSSGWHPRRAFSLNRQPDLAPRMPVALEGAGNAVPFRLVDGLLTPCGGEVDDLPTGFMIKTVPSRVGRGAIFGLSSGGGSAVFERGQAVYRLKRCGQAYDGLTDEPFFTHAIVSTAGDILEVTNKPLGGLMTVATAIMELKMADLFHRSGLSPAIEPLGMYIVTALPGLSETANAAAIIYRVESDLRLDEMVYMTLSPVFAELFEAGAVSYDPTTGWWDAAGAPLSRVLQLWPDILGRVDRLGTAAGGCFRNIHELGYLRGKGSSWFGNEVVDASGRLSAVDFDGGTGRAYEYPPEMVRSMQAFEINCYCAESFWFLKDMRPSTLGLFGSVFLEGFRAGYQVGADAAVPPEDVNAAIAAHLAAWPALQRAFQFDTQGPE